MNKQLRYGLVAAAAALTVGAPLGAAAARVPAVKAQAAAPAGLSAADRALVDRAARYLEGLTAAQGDFVQTDPRGVTTQGKYWLKRPGKIRFEYDRGLVVASDGANVKMHDPRLKTFDQYPLSQTPLSVFLARNVRLDQGVRVDRVTRGQTGFTIVARDARRPNDGSIALSFVDQGGTLRLSEWTITDAQNQRTRVQLTTLQTVRSLNDSLFRLQDPNRRTGRS